MFIVCATCNSFAQPLRLTILLPTLRIVAMYSEPQKYFKDMSIGHHLVFPTFRKLTGQ